MPQSTERPAQLGLPEIGDMPIRLEVTNLDMGLLIIHRPDLLVDCITKYVKTNTFEIISPDYESGIRIQKYFRGDNDA